MSVVKKILPYLICLLLTVVIVTIHLNKNFDSMLNNYDADINYSYIENLVSFHKDGLYAFSKRPFTTYFVENLSSLFSIKIGLAFIIVNFSILFLSGVVLYRLSQFFSKDRRLSNINILVFFLCFTNFFIFYPPIYTYDEPIQFLFILLSFLALFHQKRILFLLAFSLAIIARESSILLLPGIFVLMVASEDKKQLRDYFSKASMKIAALLTFPIIVYVTYLLLSSEHAVSSISGDLFSRFQSLKFNFQDNEFIIESITAFLITTVFPLYFVVTKLKEKANIDVKFKKHLMAYIVTLVINTIIVFTSTFAREIRLFIVPMLFLWPLFSLVFKEQLKLYINWGLYKKTFKKLKNVLLFLAFNSLNFWFCFFVYKTTISDVNCNLFNEYFFVSNLIISLNYLLSKTHKKAQDTNQI